MGKIYANYINQIRSLQNAGLRKKRSLIATEEKNTKKTQTILNIENNIEANLEEIIKDNCSWAEIEQHYAATSNYRMQEIFKSDSTDKILQKWVQYKKPFGYKLIEIDFNAIHPNMESIEVKFTTLALNMCDVLDRKLKDKNARCLLTNLKQKQNISQIKNCDIVLDSSTSKNGSFQSPMYPGTYPQKTFCRYDFRGKGRERIQIIFTEFSVPSEGDPELCDIADTVKIFLYVRSEKKIENVETLCGDTMPKPIMSNGPRMVLEFRGDKSGKGNRGFRADYIFLENFGVTTGKQMPDEYCSFHFNSSNSVSGWFHSPNFPGFYPRNIECSYFFHGGNLDKVLIKFSYFDVEGIPPCDEYTASDSVELSNFLTTDRKFMRHCGQTRDFFVRSDGRFFRITFRSNDRLDGTGFRAFYAFETEKATTETIPVIESSSMAKRYKFSKLELSSIVTIAVLINYIKSCYINL